VSKDNNAATAPPSTALFGIFDGHGGKEVALFTAKHLPSTLTHMQGYRSGDMKVALAQAFMEIDNLLMDKRHRNELLALKGTDDDDDGGRGGGGDRDADDYGVTISGSQLPEALLEALGVSGDSSGLVFKIVKAANGEMHITEDGGNGESDGQDGSEGNEEELGTDSLSTLLELVGGDDTESSEEDAGPAFRLGKMSTTPDDNNNSNSNSKRKRAEKEVEARKMDTAEDEDPEKEGPSGVVEIEELNAHSTVIEEEWSGPSSGCTAVCALIRGDDLIVANAGDSRCVLSRGGKAIALTHDHKPNDPEEFARISRAGGFVADGRVNGSLNLSRALGDLEYKQTAGLSPEEQMVTANPEIRQEKLQPEDEFLILACDGIWDVLSNQDAVDFVREELVNGLTPQQVAEQMCDRCLAPDTSGCGKGCDNMSVVIVVFKDSDLVKSTNIQRGGS
jgi:protein phosphatase 1G